MLQVQATTTAKVPAPQADLKHPHTSNSRLGGGTQPKRDGSLAKPLTKIFPFEQTISNLNASPTVKQLLLMVSNLAPAIAASELLKPLHVTSFVASPIAISAMHLTNRGDKQLHKLLFTSLSSVTVIALQKLMNLPRALIRPIMALAVFFIEKNGTKNKQAAAPNHTHNSECNHDDHSQSPVSNTLKGDLFKLLKLQGQINTVPWVINSFVHKLKETNNLSSSFISRALGGTGIFVLQVLGLSFGFVGLGHLIDDLFLRFNVLDKDESLAMRTEGAVCACCGAPVCVAEAASEVGSMSVT